MHVERFNQRLKQFKLIGRTILLSLAPLSTQMVVVACGLVNFHGKFFASNLSIPILLCKEYLNFLEPLSQNLSTIGV